MQTSVSPLRSVHRDEALQASSGSHGPKDASSAESQEGSQHDCPVCRRTCTAGQEPRRLAPARRAVADLVAEELDIFLAGKRGLLKAWADRLGIERQVVARFRQEGGPRVTLADLLLLDRESAQDFLSRIKARLRGQDDIQEPEPRPESIDQLVRWMTREGGKFVGVFDDVFDDRTIDQDELQRLEAAAKEVHARLDDVVTKARAHAGAHHKPLENA